MKLIFNSTIFLFLLLVSNHAYSQIIVRAQVVDSISKCPISRIGYSFNGKKKQNNSLIPGKGMFGGHRNKNGFFKKRLSSKYNWVMVISAEGYEDYRINLNNYVEGSTIIILLKQKQP